MTCNMCKHEWCWFCGGHWRYENHFGDDYSLIKCGTFDQVPDTFKHKIKWYLYFLLLIIISPLIMTLKKAVEFCKATGFLPCCFSTDNLLINLLVMLPINLSIAILHFALALGAAAIASPLYSIIFIYKNGRQFVKIMRYWSSGNRFKGDGKVKAELFIRRASSRGYARSPTIHFYH